MFQDKFLEGYTIFSGKARDSSAFGGTTSAKGGRGKGRGDKWVLFLLLG